MSLMTMTMTMTTKRTMKTSEGRDKEAIEQEDCIATALVQPS